MRQTQKLFVLGVFFLSVSIVSVCYGCINISDYYATGGVAHIIYSSLFFPLSAFTLLLHRWVADKRDFMNSQMMTEPQPN